MMPVARLPTVQALRGADALRPLMGTVDPVSVSEEPLATPGFSGAHHTRLRVRASDGVESIFVLKHAALADDWTYRMSGAARHREAELLSAPPLDDVWEVFNRPYLAFAEEPGVAAFLMEDLTPFLFPDVREPLPSAAEALLVESLAALHARFLNDEAASLPWLTGPTTYLDLFRPDLLARQREFTATPHGRTIVAGWETALARVSDPVAALLRVPGAELSSFWRGLPHTVVHGDAKVANFALMPDGRLGAFDWAMMGWAPPSNDLGWYLAVNATRLADSKELLLERYRAALEERMAHGLADPVWERIERHAVLAGARSLLWSKANALEAGRPGAAEEWSWWVDRLASI